MLKKILKFSVISIISIASLLFIGLNIYASRSYTPLEEMTSAMQDIDVSEITISEDDRAIYYRVEDSLKQLVFIPGGLVDPHSYDYIAVNLASSGYNVTVFKPFYNLAILSPQYASRYLDESLENVIIGHSLGGVVASMIASEHDVQEVILMGSYPIADLTEQSVLMITAEFDVNLDRTKYEESFQYLDDVNEVYIEGGNHAQFGWYGPQKGDGTATISTETQQNIVIEEILQFIK
jgi:pimeloyl-ACP methyl ester carboxylesterase